LDKKKTSLEKRRERNPGNGEKHFNYKEWSAYFPVLQKYSKSIKVAIA
jgi:hypothetical protein